MLSIFHLIGVIAAAIPTASTINTWTLTRSTFHATLSPSTSNSTYSLRFFPGDHEAWGRHQLIKKEFKLIDILALLIEVIVMVSLRAFLQVENDPEIKQK